MDCETEDMLGFCVYAGSHNDVNKEIFGIIDHEFSRCYWAACINPHSYVVSKQQPDFACALLNSDWLVPDGSGIVLASYVLRGKIRNRITGSEIFNSVNSGLASRGGRIFLLGATDEVLGLIRARLKVEMPGIEVSGQISPSFTSEFSESENNSIVAAINAAGPDVLWVGMSSPKQDLWIYRNRDRLNVKFAASVGAVFDFYSDKVKRSPRVFQILGLEWLPRLLQEPRRLWRRTFVSAPIFLWDLLQARWRSST